MSFKVGDKVHDPSEGIPNHTYTVVAVMDPDVEDRDLVVELARRYILARSRFMAPVAPRFEVGKTYRTQPGTLYRIVDADDRHAIGWRSRYGGHEEGFKWSPFVLSHPSRTLMEEVR